MDDECHKKHPKLVCREGVKDLAFEGYMTWLILINTKTDSVAAASSSDNDDEIKPILSTIKI